MGNVWSLGEEIVEALGTCAVRTVSAGAVCAEKVDAPPWSTEVWASRMEQMESERAQQDINPQTEQFLPVD